MVPDRRPKAGQDFQLPDAQVAFPADPQGREDPGRFDPRIFHPFHDGFDPGLHRLSVPQQNGPDFRFDRLQQTPWNDLENGVPSGLPQTRLRDDDRHPFAVRLTGPRDRRFDRFGRRRIVIFDIERHPAAADEAFRPFDDHCSDPDVPITGSGDFRQADGHPGSEFHHLPAVDDLRPDRPIVNATFGDFFVLGRQRHRHLLKLFDRPGIFLRGRDLDVDFGPVDPLQGFRPDDFDGNGLEFFVSLRWRGRRVRRRVLFLVFLHGNLWFQTKLASPGKNGREGRKHSGRRTSRIPRRVRLRKGPEGPGCFA